MGSVRDMAAVRGHVHTQARVCVCGVSTSSQLTPLGARTERRGGKGQAEEGRMLSRPVPRAQAEVPEHWQSQLLFGVS